MDAEFFTKLCHKMESDRIECWDWDESSDGSIIVHSNVAIYVRCHINVCHNITIEEGGRLVVVAGGRLNIIGCNCHVYGTMDIESGGSIRLLNSQAIIDGTGVVSVDSGTIMVVGRPIINLGIVRLSGERMYVGDDNERYKRSILINIVEGYTKVDNPDKHTFGYMDLSGYHTTTDRVTYFTSEYVFIDSVTSTGCTMKTDAPDQPPPINRWGIPSQLNRVFACFT